MRSANESNFDFGWVGFTNSHKDMGIVQDSWFSDEAASTFAKWDSISDCGSQGYYMAVEARAPTIPFEEGGTTFWEIRSCSFIEGKSVEDLKASDEAWNDYNDKEDYWGRMALVAGSWNLQFFGNRFPTKCYLQHMGRVRRIIR